MAKTTIITIALVLGFFLILGLFKGAITGNLVQEEKLVLTFPAIADFLHEEQGVVEFEFGFPIDGFTVGGKSPDIILFLDSEVVPGLKIGYDVKEKKIYAGLPLIASTPVVIADGNHHKLNYLFSKADGTQAIFVDGALVAQGAYTGEKAGSIPSGFAVYQGWTTVQVPYKIRAQFE